MTGVSAAVPGEFDRRDLVRRAVSAVVLIPLAVGAIWIGMPVFHIVVAAVGGLAAWEWRRLCGPMPIGTAALLLLTVPATIAVAALAGPAIALGGVAGLAVAAYGLARLGAAPHAAWASAGVVYLGLPAVAMVMLRMVPEGRFMVLWLFIVVWATDTGAYVAGRLIGGPKLAPALSPNKTQAGLAGGVVLAAAIGAAMGWTLGATPSVLPLVAAVVLALVAQGGDLFESAVKRRFGAKDAGRLIPGHGGVLDRVDGLIGAATALAIIVWLSGGEAVWR